MFYITCSLNLPSSWNWKRNIDLKKKNIGSCRLVIRHFFVIFFLAIFMNKSDDVQNDFLAVSNIRYLRMAELCTQALSARDYLTIHR
jgi:hypothetical protein